MFQQNMEVVEINSRKYILPADYRIGMVFYKIECQLLLMLNFYYIYETDLVSNLNYGDVFHYLFYFLYLIYILIILLYRFFNKIIKNN